MEIHSEASDPRLGRYALPTYVSLLHLECVGCSIAELPRIEMVTDIARGIRFCKKM